MRLSLRRLDSRPELATETGLRSGTALPDTPHLNVKAVHVTGELAAYTVFRAGASGATATAMGLFSSRASPNGKAETDPINERFTDDHDKCRRRGSALSLTATGTRKGLNLSRHLDSHSSLDMFTTSSYCLSLTCSFP